MTTELAELLSSEYILEPRKEIDVIGCGMMKTLFLNGKR